MSGYAFVENGEISEIHYFLPINWRNISNFNVLTEEEMLGLGWYPIIDYLDYDSSLYDLVDSQIVFVDGIVKRIPVVIEKQINTVIEENIPPTDNIDPNAIS
jgi:hypothetical protein